MFVLLTLSQETLRRPADDQSDVLVASDNAVELVDEAGAGTHVDEEQATGDVEEEQVEVDIKDPCTPMYFVGWDSELSAAWRLRPDEDSSRKQFTTTLKEPAGAGAETPMLAV